MRWLWFAPVALMALYGAYLGVRHGRVVANLSETETIAAFAAHYAADVPGGRAADCVARPGTGPVWLVIDCAPTPFVAARHRRYLVGHGGRAIAGPDGI